MKQSITTEQYQELTEVEKQRFDDWSTNKGLLLGSIGHLIWFLDDHHATDNAWWDGGFISKQEVIDPNTKNESINWCVYNAGKHKINYNAVELVDALWEAVKIVLSTESKEKQPIANQTDLAETILAWVHLKKEEMPEMSAGSIAKLLSVFLLDVENLCLEYLKDGLDDEP